jgi:hypothetical protein
LEHLLSFLGSTVGKKIIIVGLTNITEQICTILPWNINYIIDVEKKSIGHTILSKPIFPPEILQQENPANIVLIVAGYYNLFIEQWFVALGLQRNVNYYFAPNLLEWFSYTNNVGSEKLLNIVRMDGGLGSQMTQYAIGLLLKEKLDVQVKYDLSWFSIGGKDINGKENRNFCLTDIFDMKDFEAADESEIKQYKAFYYYNHSKYCLYDESLVNVRCNRYIDGYFGNYKYLVPIMELLKEKFRFNLPLSGKNLSFLKKIKDTEVPVAIHVRRGDYVGSMFDILNEDYYQRAVQFLLSKLAAKQIHFFAFSNDVQWVKDNIHLEQPVTYVDCNDNDNGAFDMHLMSQCKHFIIANSGFSSWAAILGNAQNKIVIAPNRSFDVSAIANNPILVASLEGHDDIKNKFPDWNYLSV